VWTSSLTAKWRRIALSSGTHASRRRRRPCSTPLAALESLEDRQLLSALTVTTAADSGAGSLRAEIAAAHAGDTIHFASSLDGQTITLTSGELLINKGLTIQGPGAAQLTISGGNSSRVFDVNSSQPVVLTGLTISNGAHVGGGGIYDARGSNLTVSACTISNCHADILDGGSGGGIYNYGILTLSGCTISGDSARNSGEGGGILNAGQMRASNCTLSGDSASSGGGIYDFFGHQVWLTNCTIAGNSAYSGGGVYVGPGTTTIVSLTNCTVSLNKANMLFGAGGGGIYVAGILHLNNTIVAGNTVDGLQVTTGADINGLVGAASGHNLIGNGTGCSIDTGNGNIVGSRYHLINAMLGPLQDNGGPTMTMALLAGSPAIGHALNSVAPATDQRGVARVDEPGELTDIGAFEV
jgi:large repetitive protein